MAGIYLVMGAAAVSTIVFVVISIVDRHKEVCD
jgi:hypothetical protein